MHNAIGITAGLTSRQPCTETAQYGFNARTGFLGMKDKLDIRASNLVYVKEKYVIANSHGSAPSFISISDLFRSNVKVHIN